MKLYIAGPMRGVKDYNFPAFFEAEADLEAMGHEPLNPARRDVAEYGEVMFVNDNGDPGQLEERGFNMRHALAADMRFITMAADGICLLPGWRSSTGATIEADLGRALGLEVHELSYWMDARDAPRAEEMALADAMAERVGPLEDDTVLAHVADILDEREEIRTVSSTGGMKGVKLARFDLIPTGPLTELAEHFGRTAQKYPPDNWRAGFEWSKCYAALLRHVTQFWAGEDLDEELGSPHLAAVAWHAMILLEFMRTRPEFDDRPKTYQLPPLVTLTEPPGMICVVD